MEKTVYYILTFVDTHSAIEAEARLLAQGLTVRMMPLPESIKAGCGLCLRFSADILPAINEFRAGTYLNLTEVYAVQRFESGEWRLCEVE